MRGVQLKNRWSKTSIAVSAAALSLVCSCGSDPASQSTVSLGVDSSAASLPPDQPLVEASLPPLSAPTLNLENVDGTLIYKYWLEGGAISEIEPGETVEWAHAERSAVIATISTDVLPVEVTLRAYESLLDSGLPDGEPTELTCGNTETAGTDDNVAACSFSMNDGVIDISVPADFTKTTACLLINASWYVPLSEVPNGTPDVPEESVIYGWRF